MTPGQPIDLPEPLARKLLARVPEKVRLAHDEIRPGMWIEWLSPALHACQAEVLVLHPEGIVEVFHPLTEILCRIPVSWVIRILDKTPRQFGQRDALPHEEPDDAA